MSEEKHIKATITRMFIELNKEFETQAKGLLKMLIAVYDLGYEAGFTAGEKFNE